MTPRKTVTPWKNISENVIEGETLITWKHSKTGEVRTLQSGYHPDDTNLVDPVAQSAFDDELEFEETATDRLAVMLQDTSGSERAELKVYRVPATLGPMEYCKAYTPLEFEQGGFDMIRSNFGPGEYEFRLYATNPETRKFVVRSRLRQKIAALQGGEIATTPNGLPAGMAQMFTMLAEGQKNMMEALISIKQAPAKDMMDEMTKTLAMMTQFREAMGITATPQKSSIGEIVLAMKELRAVSEEFSPPKEEKEESLMGMLPKVLDVVSTAMQQRQQPIEPPTLAFPTVTMPAGASFAPTSDTFAAQEIHSPNLGATKPAENNDVKALSFLKMRAYMKSLIDMASVNTDIQTGADFVNTHLPDDLLEIMELPNWFTLLSAVETGVTPYQEWLTKVRDRVIAMMDEPESEGGGQ